MQSVQESGDSRPFLFVFAALLVLTLCSFGVAQSPLMETPWLGWAVMLGISLAKAILVVLFFMHFLWERVWKYAVTLPVVFLAAVLVLLLIPDIAWRLEHYSLERRERAPQWPTAPAPGQLEGTHQRSMQ